jgi:hypothetical protein
MRMPIVVGLALSAVMLAGCGGHKAVEINPQEQVVGSRWNASLATPTELAGAIQVKGNAWMGADSKDPSRTLAHVSISNAAPGGQHPWHVHIGSCGSDQGIFGPTNAYSPLKVNGDGQAQSDAVLPVALPREGQYFVTVHASAANMGTILACGNLAPPSR